MAMRSLRPVFTRGAWRSPPATPKADVTSRRRREPEMIFLLVGVMALLGGTTFLALQQPVARNPVLNRQLTGIGLALCLLIGAVALAVTAVIAP